MGGDDCNRLQVLEMSEENEFTWTVKADLPAKRYMAASVEHEGKIWLIGGIVSWQTSSSVLIYDVEADSWGNGPALPLAATCVRATTLNGELLVTGSGAGNWIYRNAEWVEGPYELGVNWGQLSSVTLG